MTENAYRLLPIGHVRQSDEGFRLEIMAPYRAALKQLEHFSHVMVLWWADQCDDDLYRGITECEPPYAAGHVTGIFATRSPMRPNPIAVTTCPVVSVDIDAGIVRVGWIDAFDGTPVVDLKAYFPVSDRVKEPRIPAWLSEWPAWMPEDEDWIPPGMDESIA